MRGALFQYQITHSALSIIPKSIHLITFSANLNNKVHVRALSNPKSISYNANCNPWLRCFRLSGIYPETSLK